MVTLPGGCPKVTVYVSVAWSALWVLLSLLGLTMPMHTTWLELITQDVRLLEVNVGLTGIQADCKRLGRCPQEGSAKDYCETVRRMCDALRGDAIPMANKIKRICNLQLHGEDQQSKPGGGNDLIERRPVEMCQPLEHAYDGGSGLICFVVLNALAQIAASVLLVLATKLSLGNPTRTKVLLIWMAVGVVALIMGGSSLRRYKDWVIMPLEEAEVWELQPVITTKHDVGSGFEIIRRAMGMQLWAMLFGSFGLLLQAQEEGAGADAGPMLGARDVELKSGAADA